MKKVIKKKEESVKEEVQVECKCTKVNKLDASFGNGELNQVVEKLNEVIETINKCQ